MSDVPDSEWQSFLMANCEKIELMYERSLRHGVSSPVILVFDISDADARLCATLFSSAYEVAEHERRARESGTLATLIVAVPQGVAAVRLSMESLLAGRILASVYPANIFPVGVITKGGTHWGLHKLPE
jgi:hypothetical protein